MTERWGHIHDPETEAVVAQYKEMALWFTPPHEQSLRNRAVIATQSARLLAATYEGSCPIDTDQYRRAVVSGEAAVWTLHNGPTLLATADLVRQPKPMFARGTRFAELGRLGIRPNAPKIASGLLRARLSWASQYLRGQNGVDVLHGSTLLAAPLTPDVPNGSGTQAPWWIPQQEGAAMPTIATTLTPEWRTGGVWPSLRFMMPIAAGTWRSLVNTQRVYVPNEQARTTVATLLSESTGSAVMPEIRVLQSQPAYESVAQYRSPSHRAMTQYVATRCIGRAPRLDKSALYAELVEPLAIGQHVTVEADMTSQPEGAAVMEGLERQGWTLCGWLPSAQYVGGLALAYSRLSPHCLDSVQPAQCNPRYFDECKLPQTRAVLETMQAHLLRRAEIA